MSVARMQSLTEPFIVPCRMLWSYRLILIRTSIAEIRNIYAGSVLGSAWVLIGQLAVLGIYSLTFVVIYKIKPSGMTVYEYILYVFCGLSSFLPFSNSLSAGALSLVSNRAVLLNTVFPAELIPLRSVLVASVSMPTSALILAVADIALSEASWMTLLVPVVMVLQLMFTAGLAWLLSLAALVVRDIQHVIQYAVMMLAVVTPIAYTPDMVPGAVKALVYVNPLSYFVMSFQYLVVLNRLPEPQILVPMLVLSIGLFVLGFAALQRAKGAFYDYA